MLRCSTKQLKKEWFAMTSRERSKAKKQDHCSIPATSLAISLLAGTILLLVSCVTPQTPAAKFESTWESLDQYTCPEWFRDAKLGIFVCWNLHSVPAFDDWYARNMYIEGSRAYKHHVKQYGHPSKFGFKDFIPMWKGENFDPDALVRSFKQAGAKYIVPIATYHDNFDLWDSKYQEYNSVNMGPKKDITGLWRKATLKHGLRFGVTTHLTRSYSWLQVSHGSDKQGPFKGIPYDGADPKYERLYHETHDDTSYKYPLNPPEHWKQEWFNRIRDLVDQHQPDLLYFDGGVPFGQLGRRMMAYYFNQNIRQHNGKLQAVLNIKKWENGHGDYRDGMCVRDMERGVLGEIMPEPWQTDTSIGPWFWTKGKSYKSVDAIVDIFVDIVSKNGNLLLNVPPKADGTLDKNAQKFLVDLGRWMDVNGEAIYGTRPWKIFGEGPTTAPGGHFKEQKKPFTSQDIRFTTKGSSLYAICLDWPQETDTITIKSLSTENSPGKILKVTLLGHTGRLKYQLDADGLKIKLPPQKPCDYAYAFKINISQ